MAVELIVVRQYDLKYSLYYSLIYMPIISKKKYTIWCENCNAVFDDPAMANEHQEKEKHRMNQTEYFTSC